MPGIFWTDMTLRNNWTIQNFLLILDILQFCIANHDDAL